MRTCHDNRCETSQQPAGSAFSALRREFERQFGIETAPELAGMTVTELPDRWLVQIDVPGVAESDIDITFEDGSLVISGERKPGQLEGGRNLFNDRGFGKFRRVLKVREVIARDGIEADLRDGVLTLVLHRSPESAPRKISIRSSAAN